MYVHHIMAIYSWYNLILLSIVWYKIFKKCNKPNIVEIYTYPSYYPQYCENTYVATILWKRFISF